LAECGYDAEWRNIPAGLLGARHLRTRVWLVAYSNKIGRLAGEVFPRKYAQEHNRAWASNTAERLIDLGRRGKFSLPEHLCVDDGVPTPLGGYGNAVVPQIPEMIGRAILAAEMEAAA
jgi:DNA (cytosine-5)-methyltransferase 1